MYIVGRYSRLLLYAVWLSLQIFRYRFGEKNILSFLANVSNGKECRRELVLLFLNSSSSRHTKAEYNEIGREKHLPCSYRISNTARHTVTKHVCDLRSWGGKHDLLSYAAHPTPTSTSKSMSRKAKFAFGDGWPLVTAFPIIITALIAHIIFLFYPSFLCLPHDSGIVFCYFFSPFHSYLLVVITQDSMCSRERREKCISPYF